MSKWIVVMPNQEPFMPSLILRLFSPGAPAHIWVNRPELKAFIMKAEDFQKWFESGDGGPIEAISPRLVNTYDLECEDEIDRLMEEIRLKQLGRMVRTARAL